MLNLKKLLTKVMTAFYPSASTISTTVGTVGMWRMGKFVTIELRGVASGQSGIITLANLPKPKGYYVVQLYEGTTVNGILYPSNSNEWTLRRLGGTGSLYGAVTYMTED